jgi:hypothetical protein
MQYPPPSMERLRRALESLSDRRANPGTSAGPTLDELRFGAAVRREFKRRRAEMKPLADAAPAGVTNDPRAFVAWTRERLPGAFEAALAGTAGKPRKERRVTPVQPLDGIPPRVWHGTRSPDDFLLDGVRLPPAERMGNGGKMGWGWTTGSYRWGPSLWRWFEALPPSARDSVARQTKTTIASMDDLGRAISLLFVMRAGAMYAMAYAAEHHQASVLELDTSRLPILGFIDDHYVAGGAAALILPAKGFQGGPDAVVDAHPPRFT